MKLFQACVHASFTLTTSVTLLLAVLSPAAVRPEEVLPPYSTDNQDAETRFVDGIDAFAMFSFYVKCPDTFQEAIDLDGNFTMAHWGRAMCYEHVIWAEQYQQSGWDAIKDVPDFTGNLHQDMYINATKHLFLPNITIEERRANHVEVLRTISSQFPTDEFVKLMIAMNLIAMGNPSTFGFLGTTQKLQWALEARQLVLQVLENNPESPLAHHLFIHVTDMPHLAELARESASKLGSLSPNYPHAHHMPSHTWIRLGDYDKCIQANKNALAADPNDDHSNQFLNYCLLNIGDAQGSTTLMQKYLAKEDDLWARVRANFMTDNYLIVFKEAPFIPDPLTMPPETKDPNQSPENFGTAVWVSKSYAAALFSHGYLDLLRGGNGTLYDECKTELEKLASFLHDQWNDEGLDYDMMLGIGMYELLPALVSGNVSVNDLQSAAFISTAFEARSPPGYGYPTFPQYPGPELYGDLLMSVGKYEIAKTAYEYSLGAYVNRLPSLVGALKASIAANDVGFALHYWTIFENQLKADDDYTRSRFEYFTLQSQVLAMNSTSSCNFTIVNEQQQLTTNVETSAAATAKVLVAFGAILFGATTIVISSLPL